MAGYVDEAERFADTNPTRYLGRTDARRPRTESVPGTDPQ
jgi:hypothetical protein